MLVSLEVIIFPNSVYGTEFSFSQKKKIMEVTMPRETVNMGAC